jgi:ABC-2 type transport system ATP-binding protein
VHEVLAAQRGDGVIVKVKDLPAGLAALTAAGLDVTPTEDALRVAVAPEDAERISRTLAERGLYVIELRPDEVDLETVFLELTADEPADPGPGVER